MDELKLDQRIQLVTSTSFIERVDQWRREQPNIVSRSEAIRQLVELGLKSATQPQN